MECPYRFSLTTFNVWGKQYWPERSEPLNKLFSTLKSDIYLLQEVTPEIIYFLDTHLLKYKRVTSSTDETKPLPRGWLTESNIYWNDELFALKDYGQCQLDLTEYPDRCLFWVRLSIRINPSMHIFVSTAHFPWVGSSEEILSGINQRIPTSLKVCQYFRRLFGEGECVIFGGDLNDDYHPIRILNEEMGFVDVFEALDLSPPITHPVRPSHPMEEMRPNRTLDWILSNLPSNVRVVAAFAKTIRGGSYGSSIPASDHLPIMAVFEIKPIESTSENLLVEHLEND